MFGGDVQATGVSIVGGLYINPVINHTRADVDTVQSSLPLNAPMTRKATHTLGTLFLVRKATSTRGADRSSKGVAKIDILAYQAVCDYTLP